MFGDGDALRIAADQRQHPRTPKLELYIMGGQPIREPVAHYGPLVMNTRDELAQAFADYQAVRLGVIPATQRGAVMSGPVDAVDAPPAVAGAGRATAPCVKVTDSRGERVGDLRVRRALPRKGRRTVGA